MNSKKKLRLNVLNAIIATTFILAMFSSFIDVKASYLLLTISFVMAVFSYFMRIFWSQVKQLKQEENGKQ